MSDDKKKLDLDSLHSDVLGKLQDENIDVADASERFNAILDTYDRYLDEKQKEMRHKKVSVKEIVADEDAVQETLKTYHAINKKIQQQIADGVEISPNDIKLLVSMMGALNGGGA